MKKKKVDSLSFIEHLEELRKRLIFIFVFWFLCSFFTYFFSKDIIKFLTEPLIKYQNKPVFLHPIEPFISVFKICVFIGGIFSIPFILFQIWLFISPGLTEKEKKIIKWIMIGFVFFFCIGSAFAFFILIPFGLKVLFRFGKGTMVPLISISSYLNFLMIFMIGLGLVFNFPVFTAGLSGLGLVSSEFLIQKRRFAFIGAFVISAILTPTTDIFTQIFLAIPLVILYEISIFFTKIIHK